MNGLTPELLNHNPNSLNTANNATLKSGSVSIASNPFRLDRSQAATADQDHNYGPEQMAFDAGMMDLFPLSVGTEGPPPAAPPAAVNTTALTMGYFDGNTVTGLWNYAQHFAMSDNMFNTNFGPSTPGALNVISGQTNGVTSTTVTVNNSTIVEGGGGSLTLISDADPAGDMCSSTTKNVSMTGKNIGDSAERGRHLLGILRGRLRSDDHELERHHRLRPHHQIGGHRRYRGRLHSPPPALPVLRFHPEPGAHPAIFGLGDWRSE